MQLRDRTNVAALAFPRQRSKITSHNSRKIVKASRIFSRLQSDYQDDGFSNLEFDRAVADWINPPEIEKDVTEITFPSYNSVPPQPDYSLLLDFALAEERGEFSIPVRNGCLVNLETILEEHGSMDTFLNRLLAQMLKRRWFAALTEFNTTYLFGRDTPPSRFLKFLQLVHNSIEESVCADTHLAPLWHAGQIKLVLKGGNCVAMLKLQALALLPPEIARRLECIRPTSLSDVDFLLMLDPSLPTFAALHDRLRAAAARGLAAAASSLADQRPFAALLSRMASPAALAAQRAAVLTATRTLRADVAALAPPRHVPAISRLLRALDALTAGDAAAAGPRVRPELRQGVELRHGAAATTVVALPGRPTRIYVSNNPDIEHRHDGILVDERMHGLAAHTEREKGKGVGGGGAEMKRERGIRIDRERERDWRGREEQERLRECVGRDSRCIGAGERCHFALVRAMVGYSVRLPPAAALALAHAAGPAGELGGEGGGEGLVLRMSKGELIDVSIPKQARITLLCR
jgi:hypothetical protein